MRPKMRKEMAGLTFGNLSVIEFAGNRGRTALWLCRCSCGKVVVKSGRDIRGGRTVGCGSGACRGIRPELVGQRFGELTVVEYMGHKNGAAQWRCLCDCGTECIRSGGCLRQGSSLSCGCRVRRAVTTHGKTSTKAHRAWLGAKARCCRVTSTNYSDYGGRGIKVCRRWLNSFENFYADMGDPPSPSHTLERKDNNGNYEPKNCIWADRLTQRLNNRNVRLIEFRGVTKCLSYWAQEIGMTRGSLKKRLARMTVAEALTTPKRR